MSQSYSVGGSNNAAIHHSLSVLQQLVVVWNVIFCCRLVSGNVPEETEKAAKRYLIIKHCHVFCCNNLHYV